MTAMPEAQRRRGRRLVLLITALFMAPLVAALVLYYRDWQPTHTKNYGQLLHPVRDLRDVRFTRADGSAFRFNHEDHVWRLLVAPPANCAVACERLEDALQRIWIGLGNNADSVQLLWVGAAPTRTFRNLIVVHADTGLAPRLPDVATPAAIPVYLVDPTGFLFMRYPPGFDPGGLRRDLKRLTGQAGM
ncbi:MAG: hypothetical protein JSS44_00070 [Proteobacteria bacterium]|nr:hypothetical protein [Pseudomonadota bacterium]